MNSLFSRDLCAALVLSFGHFLWMGTVIALLAAVIAMRQQTAATRYGVWLSGLVAMAVSPFATLIVLLAMSISTPVVVETQPPAVEHPSTQRPEMNDRFASQEQFASSPPSVAKSISEHSPKPGVRPLIQRNETADEVAFSVAASPRSAIWRDFAPLVTSLYLIGVALMGLRLVLGLWGGRRLRNRASLITDRSLLDALQRQADALRMKVVPAMSYCEQVTVPTVLGILKPMILLPISVASGLTTEQVESVLAHELAHLKRYDHLVNLMQCVIESLLFFHPAVWWVSRRIRDEREHCCDDLVIACGAVPLDYAASLLRVAELSREAVKQRGHNQRRSFTAVSLFATGDRPSTLRQRIARLLGYQTELNVRAVHPWVLFCLATCCVGAIWLLSSMTMIVIAEINRDRSQKTVIVEWSAIVDDSVMNEIRAINGLTTQETGAMQTPDGAKFSTLRCSADDLRTILKNHVDNKRLVALQKTIRHSMPTGGWRIGGEKRFFQMIDSEVVQTGDNTDPSYHVNWYADGNETRDEDSDRARLIVAGNYNFQQMGLIPVVTPNGTASPDDHADEAAKQQTGTIHAKVHVKFDSVITDGEATVVALSPPAVTRQYQEFVMDDKGDHFDAKTKQAPQLHAIFIHEAVRVPVKQLDQFHKLTSVEDWVRRGPDETKVHVTRVAEWQTRPSRSVSATDGKWTRLMPNGGHVQLVGLGRPNEARMIWWTPEGEPLSQISDNLGQSLTGMELAAIVRVWEDGVSRKLPPPKGMVHSGGVMDVPDTFPSKGSQLLVFPAVLDKATGKMSLKIGAGFGAWTAETKIDAVAESIATLNGIEVKTGASHESHTFGPAGPPNFIKATSTWINWKPRSDPGEVDAIAVARDGTPHPSASDPVVYSNENHGGAQHFTHHIPKADLQHFIIKSRPVHWTEFTDFATEPAVALVPPLEFGKEQETDVRPFSAMLTGGVTVNLIGVGMPPSRSLEWWQADGSPLVKSPYASREGHVSQGSLEQGECRVFFLEFLGLPKEHFTTTQIGRSGSRVEMCEIPSGIRSYMLTSGPFTGEETTTVKVGLALEPLGLAQGIDADGRKLAEVDVAPDLKPFYDRIQPIRVESREDQLELLLKPLGDLLVKVDWRLYAIGVNGKEVQPSTSSTNGEGTTYGFQLTRENLARFEYRLRPYRHSVTFENVSLHPGKKSEVKVTVASAPKPQHYIANLHDGRSVEFVGITKNTAPANEGWKPDGTSIGDVGYWPATTYISGNTIGTFTENGEHPEPNTGAIDLLFRFRGLKAQPSFSFELAAKGGSYSHWPVKDPYELRVAAERRGPSPPGSKWSIPDGEMRVGLTDEPWGRYVKISPEGKSLNPIQPDELHASTYGRIEVLGARPHDRAPTGNTVVLRSPLTDADSPADEKGSPDLFHRYAFEFRAIDTEGKNHWADSWLTSQVSNTKLKESQYGLMQPLPEGAKLSHYEYRLRPYRHWVTFTGASLELGKQSDVKVKVETLPSELEKRNAKGADGPADGLGSVERALYSELSYFGGFSPFRLDHFPQAGDGGRSVQPLEPLVSRLSDDVQAEAGRRFNEALNAIGTAGPEQIEATTDRIVSDTRDLPTVYRSALMFNLWIVLNDWETNDAFRQAFRLDSRIFDRLRNKCIFVALDGAEEIPDGLTLRLLSLLTSSLSSLNTDDDANWPTRRRAMAKFWLPRIEKIRAAIDPDWNPDDLPMINIEGPNGFPSGAYPNGIRDPKLRAEYEARLEANRRKTERYNQQHLFRRLLADLSPRMEEDLVRFYVRKPFRPDELELLLYRYAADKSQRDRFSKSVRLVNSIHPDGTQLKYGWPDTLAEAGPTGVPALMAAVRDKTYPDFIRHDGAWALGVIGDPRALETLKAVAEDETTPAKYKDIAREFVRALKEKVELERQRLEQSDETVLGKVVSPDGEPVAGIDVLAFQGEKHLEPTSKTNRRGEIRVPKEWRETEHWLTRVARDGRERLGWFDFMVHGHSDVGKKADDGSFRIVPLPMSRTVRGRIVAEAGIPLAQVPMRSNQISHDVN